LLICTRANNALVARSYGSMMFVTPPRWPRSPACARSVAPGAAQLRCESIWPVGGHRSRHRPRAPDAVPRDRCACLLFDPRSRRPHASCFQAVTGRFVWARPSAFLAVRVRACPQRASEPGGSGYSNPYIAQSASTRARSSGGGMERAGKVCFRVASMPTLEPRSGCPPAWVVCSGAKEGSSVVGIVFR
jgi:hypothetical protein